MKRAISGKRIAVILGLSINVLQKLSTEYIVDLPDEIRRLCDMIGMIRIDMQILF